MKRIQSAVSLMVIGFLLTWGGGCAARGEVGGISGAGCAPWEGEGPPPECHDALGDVDVDGNPSDANIDADGNTGGGSGDTADDDSNAGGNDEEVDGANEEGIDGGDNPPTGEGSAVVKTRIVVGNSGKIEVGDDLIVYGADPTHVDSNQPAGVLYIIPSQSSNQTASGTMIPGSDVLFDPYDFKVVGRKVALVRSTHAVSIYDTQTGRLVDISPTEITLLPSGADPHGPGQMSADGAFIAAINNPGGGGVLGTTNVAVIDVSGADPVILNFPRPVDLDSEENFDQVSVHADSRRVVALGGDNFYLYELDQPGSQPTKFDFGYQAGNGRISEEVQIRFDGDHVLYHDDEGFDPMVSLLDVADGTITHFNDNPTDWDAPLALAGGSFGYFLFREDADNESRSFKTNVYRSAIGRIDGAPSAMLASQLDHYDFRPTDVDEPGAGQDLCLNGKKLIGYGATQCITPDGRRWFLAGWSTVDANYDYVQVSRGGTFSDIPDPERTTYTGSLMGSDIVCSADTVAFRGLREVDDVIACGTTRQEVIAFIRLDRFDQ